MDFVSHTFNVSVDTDPFKLGWKPCYWGDVSFRNELDVLILDRCPTPPAPDWERYVAADDWERYKAKMNSPEFRGMARQEHDDGRHFVGEFLVTRVTGDRHHRPAGRLDMRDLESITQDLRTAQSNLWATARVPSDWKAPDWYGEPWQKELAALVEEMRAIEAIKARRKQESAAGEADRLAASEARKAETTKRPPAEIRFRRVDELDLSVHAANCLQNAGIETLGQLTEKTEGEMLKTKNFGRRTLNEIKEVLEELGLRLGMTDADFEKGADPTDTET